MSAIPLGPDTIAGSRGQRVAERLLREPAGIWQQIKLDYRLRELLPELLLTSMGALAGYGVVLGASHRSLAQMLAAGVKLPLLYLLTLAVCLPALYVFNLLNGGNLSVRQVLALVLSATALIGLVTLPLAPIALFFLITAWNYSFFVLLNVLILAMTGAIGLRFLLRGVIYLNTPERGEVPADGQPARHPQQLSLGLIQIWLVLYAFVGTQLSWALRPIFGDPDLPFVLFDRLEGNFYTGVLERILGLL
jgi:hypothetical protein